MALIQGKTRALWRDRCISTGVQIVTIGPSIFKWRTAVGTTCITSEKQDVMLVTVAPTGREVDTHNGWIKKRTGRCLEMNTKSTANQTPERYIRKCVWSNFKWVLTNTARCYLISRTSPLHTYIHNLYLTWEKLLAIAILPVFHKLILRKKEICT